MAFYLRLVAIKAENERDTVVAMSATCMYLVISQENSAPHWQDNWDYDRHHQRPASAPAEEQQYSNSTFVRHDVGTYTRQDVLGMSDNDKLWLLLNAFTPGPSYKFPHREEYGKKQSFQGAWSHQFSWLCFSETCNDGFCVVCFLLAKHPSSLGQLVTSAMTNFTRAKLTLKKHSQQYVHLMAHTDAVDFRDRVERGISSG